MYVIVAYDISNNKNRNIFAKELLKFGIRTQKSFFEFENLTKKEINIIKKLIDKYAEPEDFVTIYSTTPNKIKRAGNVEYLTIEDLVF